MATKLDPITQFSVGDVLRTTVTYPSQTTGKISLSVVTGIEEVEDGLILSRVQIDGERRGNLHIDSNGEPLIRFATTKPRKNTERPRIDSTVENLGQAPDDFGEHYITFRPPNQRDHIVRTTLEGYNVPVCHYSVGGGEEILLEDVSSRQRQLISMCHECDDYAREHELYQELPKCHLKEELYDKVVGEPFSCPHCGEEPDYIEYDSMLHGMCSIHTDDENRRCGPWRPDIHLKWRLQS